MNWLMLGIFGGFVGADATSFPQVMISRPFIAATLAGWILGDPLSGAALGVFLEIFTLVVLPVGAARYPESGTAAAAASAALISSGASIGNPSLLLLAAVFALVWERVSGLTVVVGRHVNERLVANAAEAPVAERAVVRGHVLAMGIDYVRGSLSVLVGALAGRLLIGVFGPVFVLGTGTAAGVIAVAASAIAGAGLMLFGGWRERRMAFGLGVLCGSLLILTQ